MPNVHVPALLRPLLWQSCCGILTRMEANETNEATKNQKSTHWCTIVFMPQPRCVLPRISKKNPVWYFVSPSALSSVCDLAQECERDLPPGGHHGLVVWQLLAYHRLVVQGMALVCSGQHYCEVARDVSSCNARSILPKYNRHKKILERYIL